MCMIEKSISSRSSGNGTRFEDIKLWDEIRRVYSREMIYRETMAKVGYSRQMVIAWPSRGRVDRAARRE